MLAPAAAAVSLAHSAPVPAGCSSSQLALSLGQSEGAAGTVYVPLVFRNRGSRACSLRGFPGVSSVGSAGGAQIGAAAAWDHSVPVVTVVLQPGGRANAPYAQADALNYPRTRCHPTSAAGLRVYPPNQRASLYVAWRHTACASTSLVVSRVRPVRAGAGA
jgi:hypothetical protein